MKRTVLLLSIVLLGGASAEAYYAGPCFIGTPMNMVMLPGCNPALLVAGNPSLLPMMLGCSTPTIMLHTMPIISVMPNICVAPIVCPFVQPGSSVTVIGIQSSMTPSTQDMIFSIITNNAD